MQYRLSGVTVLWWYVTHLRPYIAPDVVGVLENPDQQL
jgi:hypothetical protein